MSHPIPGMEYSEHNEKPFYKPKKGETKTYKIVEKGSANQKKIGSFDRMHIYKVPEESKNSFKKRVAYYRGSRKSVAGKGAFYEALKRKSK